MVIVWASMLAGQLFASPLGTLVFSAEERHVVLAGRSHEMASGQIVHVAGMIQIRHRPKKLLLNGQWISAGEQATEDVVIEPAGGRLVRVIHKRAEKKQGVYTLKVGQHLDMANGRVQEGPPPEDKARQAMP